MVLEPLSGEDVTGSDNMRKLLDEHRPLVAEMKSALHVPLLSQMVQKYLCVPGTSVPLERVNSNGGFIVDPFRSHLKPQTLFSSSQRT